jgi:hypothetical protein
MGRDTRVCATGNSLLRRRKRTSIDVFHPTAQVADKVMMMAAEGIRQLIAGEALMKLQATNDTQIAEQLDRAVNRYPVN